MDELFEYAPKSGHVKMPFNVSFGLIHDQRDSILLTGIDQKTGKKMYLYNVRLIGQMFEDKRKQMIADKTVNTLFTWIADVLLLVPKSICLRLCCKHPTQGERSCRQNY